MKKLLFLRATHIILFLVLISSILVKILKRFTDFNINISDNIIYLTLGILGLTWILVPEKSLNSLYSDTTKISIVRTRIFGFGFLIGSAIYFIRWLFYIKWVSYNRLRNLLCTTGYMYQWMGI